MDLLETLSLAMALDVNLELAGPREKLAATPKENITPELRQAITENKEGLKVHLQGCRRSWEYKLLTEIASAGITLVLKPDGQLIASPGAAVAPLKEKIAANRDFLVNMISMDQTWRLTSSEAHARLLARSQFDTKPFEPIPTVDEAWAQPEKAAFFKDKTA